MMICETCINASLVNHCYYYTSHNKESIILVKR